MIEPAHLKGIPLLAEFGEAELAHIVESAKLRSYPRGSLIVRQDDPGGILYIILSGIVSVSRLVAPRREQTLTIMTTNDFFGEMSIFDSSLRSASVKALTDVTLG